MSAAAPRFHRLTVDDLRRESADAISMTFAIPQDLAEDYRFAPGQYLTLRATLDGEEVRRSYSICSGPDDGELRIAVKRVDGGAFSSWASEELKHGDALDVMTPTGRFGVASAPDHARIHIGFAAGSGITPILSIAKGVLAREPNSRFFLFYGNRTTTGMLFREALEELKECVGSGDPASTTCTTNCRVWGKPLRNGCAARSFTFTNDAEFASTVSAAGSGSKAGRSCGRSSKII
jgi:ring-1,2-phenylacetyl-CoA epoxidase subunit PaaE